MSDMAELTLTVEEGGANIDPGETSVGKVTGAKIKEFSYDGDDIQYYELTVEDEQSGIEFTPDWPARLTPGTSLGKLVGRFGADLAVGNDVSLHEIFQAGEKVQYEVEEEEGDDGTFLVIDEDTVRPVGEELVQEAEADSEDDGEPEISDDLRDAFEDHDLDGEKKSDVGKALAKESGDLLREFKELKETDLVTVTDDDEVFLA